MSLNKKSIYCVLLRSSKNADQRKQWWYRVAGYSAVAHDCLLKRKGNKKKILRSFLLLLHFFAVNAGMQRI